MEKGLIQKMVLDVLAEHCEGTELNSRSPLKDCFRDPVEETCFYTEIEISFGMNEIIKVVSDTFQTVSDLVNYIAEHQSEAGKI